MITARTVMITAATTTTVDVVTFHLLALAPAAVGLCCLAADRRRTRAIELGAAVLMVLAMADAAVTAIVPAVFWVVALVGGAMALAAVRGRARVGVASGEMAGGVVMAVHSAAGMVVMAALMLAMIGGGSVPAAPAHHHAGAPALAVAAVVVASAYLVASVVLAVRAHGGLARAQYVAMAGSVGLMALSFAG